VLSAACSGRLTEDWRTSHPISETVEHLLEDVLAERESAWERGKYRTPAQVETDDLTEIPEHWRYVSFDTLVSDSFYGPRFSADDYSDSDQGIPTIRTTDITFNGGIDLHDPPRIRLGTEELRDLRLKHEDLLVTRTGATIGKCALYDEEMGPAIPSAYLIRFRLTRKAVPARYALMFLMSPIGRRLLLGGSTAVAQPNVNAKNICRFPVPLPPKDEILEIVARVESLLKAADVIEERLLTAFVSVDKLNQSVLAKAFRGELVPTEAELARREGRDYEPASALLERIKAEKASLDHGKALRSKQPVPGGKRRTLAV
jgi:type I restriction enzyme S subunit